MTASDNSEIDKFTEVISEIYDNGEIPEDLSSLYSAIKEPKRKWI